MLSPMALSTSTSPAVPTKISVSHHDRISKQTKAFDIVSDKSSGNFLIQTRKWALAANSQLYSQSKRVSNFERCKLSAHSAGSEVVVSENEKSEGREESKEVAQEEVEELGTGLGEADGGGSSATLSEKKSQQAANQERRKAAWARAEMLKEKEKVHVGKVESANSGGVLVRFAALQAFLPYSQLSPIRFHQAAAPKAPSELGRELVGEAVTVKVIEVDEKDNRLVVSEKEALKSKAIKTVEEGDVFEAFVNAVTTFGAFVDIKLPNGDFGGSGLVHISEISWDPIRSADDVLAVGSPVKVKVISVNREKQQFGLSMKALLTDPLLQTLDNLLPSTSSASSLSPSLSSPSSPSSSDEDESLLSTPLPGLTDITNELLQESGILEVTLGRQGVDKRVVSQDLELWISNAPEDEGHYTLLARAGRQVQEVYVVAKLDREEMKSAIQRVTGRVP